MKVIAHRGASGITPENTIFSIKTAEMVGADIIEIDIQKTKDDVLVLFHDRTFERIDGDKNSVSNYNYNELRNKDVGKHFNQGYTGMRIPRLKEVLDQFSHLDFILEIKPSVSDVNEQKHIGTQIIELLDDYSYQFNSGYISVRNFEIFEYLKEIDENYRIGVMQKKRSCQEFHEKLNSYNVKIAQIRQNKYSRHHIEELKTIVDEIYSYCGDTPDIWDVMMKWKIDGILTNYPSALKSYLKLCNFIK